MTENPNTFGSLWQFSKRLIRFSKNRIYLIGQRIKTMLFRTKNSAIATNDPYFQPGDMVRVRSKAEILPTLDGWKRYEGCRFMDEMWQYCDTQHKVLKRVEFFFDERNSRFFKASNIVLLDGVHCSGKLSKLMPKCDRSCYLFWKEDWLKKIE